MTTESADRTFASEDLSGVQPERRSGKERRVNDSPAYFSSGGSERRAKGERRKRWERRKGYMRTTP